MSRERADVSPFDIVMGEIIFLYGGTYAIDFFVTKYIFATKLSKESLFLMRTKLFMV